MNEPTTPFIYYTQDGRSVRQGHITVTPRAQVIGLRLPFAALIWNRPLGVTVTNEQTNSHHYQPITDPTRLVQWGLYGVVVLLLLINLRKRKA